jgi:hypothetical protein
MRIAYEAGCTLVSLGIWQKSLFAATIWKDTPVRNLDITPIMLTSSKFDIMYTWTVFDKVEGNWAQIPRKKNRGISFQWVDINYGLCAWRDFIVHLQ